jgi:lantibiotic modifying enzyme
MVDRLARKPLRPGLYSGLAGIGWVMGHLVEDEEPCAAIDVALVRHVARPSWREPFDLIEGLVGIGVYALERLSRPAGKRLLGAVVGHLGETAVRRTRGVAWSNPNAVFDLGVAHGAAGVIAVLGRVIDADVDARTKKSARALLEKSVAWLLAQELPRTSDGCFATAVGKGIRRKAARLGWCYGDPGIAATLLVAARACRKPAWERAALRIGLRAAARSEASSGIRDAGLCHGAAGVAHVFHQLYRTTHEKRFAEASRLWFTRALAMRAPADSGFLMGAAGIALALLAATSNAEPAWNRVLLLP